ncbi:hypothetical protein [Arthrobacter sp. NPDC090010]|uniref:hypothetical protein n=1 Tax=Arthrobacter sp. NPDC090010 TaxID=3363942 RepID=UPI0037FDAB8E
MHRPGPEGDKDGESWDRLVTAWRDASVQDGWRHPADWDLAPVTAVARELSGSPTLSSALAAELGLARAEAGVGIQETLQDLHSLYETVGIAPEFDVVSALAAAWAEGVQSVAELGCVDIATGLFTSAHFQHRLQELLQDDAEQAAEMLVARFTLQADAPEPARLGWALLAELGDCVRRTLGHGPCAAHLPGAVAVLVQDSPESQQRLDSCRGALEALRDGVLRPVVLTQHRATQNEPIPPTAEARKKIS